MRWVFGTHSEKRYKNKMSCESMSKVCVHKKRFQFSNLDVQMDLYFVHNMYWPMPDLH